MDWKRMTVTKLLVTICCIDFKLFRQLNSAYGYIYMISLILALVPTYASDASSYCQSSVKAVWITKISVSLKKGRKGRRIQSSPLHPGPPMYLWMEHNSVADPLVENHFRVLQNRRDYNKTRPKKNEADRRSQRSIKKSYLLIIRFLFPPGGYLHCMRRVLLF